MPPEPRIVPRFAAEPPQDPLPSDRWERRLAAAFLAACADVELDDGEQPGELGEPRFYPDRSYGGGTYVPAVCESERGLELFGAVTFVPAEHDDDEPADLQAFAAATEETAAANPDWQLDLCDEVIGRWRGEHGEAAAITLIWGRALVAGGSMATAELGALVVDQCRLEQERFTLVAPDTNPVELLEVALWDRRGRQLARESLYDEDERDADA